MTSKEWEKCKLESISSLISRGITPKYTNNCGCIVLNQKCIRGGTISYKNARNTDNIAKPINPIKYVKRTDTLICSTGIGTLGRVGRFKNEYNNFTTVDSHITIVRSNKCVNPMFLNYNLFGRQAEIEALAEGTTGQTELPKKKLEQLIIQLPPLETQHKIAKILSAIDDKIELNNSVNNNLEQQAQAIFKSWFIDFEPFDGTMPNNWSISTLSTIADYLNGLAMQKFKPNKNEKGIPVLKIKELRQGFCDVQSDLCSLNIKPEYLINDGDVIFSWSGTLLLDFWCSGLCGLNQHLFKVSSEKYDKWFYYFWTKHHLDTFIAIAADKATTMGHIKREDLDKSEVLIPDNKTYKRLNSILSPLINLIIKNRVENRQLTQLRDTLLPKLMSGEIDVSKVDIDDILTNQSADKLLFSEDK